MKTSVNKLESCQSLRKHCRIPTSISSLSVRKEVGAATVSAHGMHTIAAICITCSETVSWVGLSGSSCPASMSCKRGIASIPTVVVYQESKT
eukprot:1449825-Amphidinium_carterae.1